MHDLFVYLSGHKGQLVTVIAMTVSYLATSLTAMIPRDKMPTWLAYLLGWLGSQAPSGMTGIIGRWTVPLVHIPKDYNRTKVGPLGPSAAVVLMTIGMLAMNGCAYCKTPVNASTSVCKAERVITQCGPKAMGVFAQVMPLVLAEDWPAALELVVQLAPDEAECIKDVIEQTVAKARGANSAELRSFKTARREDAARRADMKAISK